MRTLAKHTSAGEFNQLEFSNVCRKRRDIRGCLASVQSFVVLGIGLVKCKGCNMAAARQPKQSSFSFARKTHWHMREFFFQDTTDECEKLRKATAANGYCPVPGHQTRRSLAFCSLRRTQGD
eukprot:287754-Amphidinium_carterae.1